ncbi:amine oxidase [Photobacterium jeanii]|uniref:Amine oxidase n=1 Tax=Photobacterium jeanii TaxID=858640 RepID=A0A178K749_9GAMM|nr:FAD-dependent oxidoreductase [Photobacterium jeanii]OAN13169.1 amine oxidase [Photobacterium jeanii]PST89321.1 FAD-binding protein [Photobacterium jeanii]
MKKVSKLVAVIVGGLLLSANVNADVNAKQKEYDYIVVGAGAAGLSAAFTLNEAKQDFLILEKNHRVGGIAENGRKGQFHYAKGTEYLGEPYGALRNIVNKLNIPMVEIPTPMDASFYQGKMHVGSDKVALLTDKVSGEKQFKHFLHVLKSNLRMLSKAELKALDNITAKQWFDDNKVDPFIQRRYDVMARGLFGANLNDISALSVLPEVAFDYLDTYSYSELLMPSDESGSWTTKQGISLITDTIAKSLGSRLRLNSEVTKVAKVGDKYQVTFIQSLPDRQTKKESVVLTKKVIVATPAPIAAWIAKDVLTAQQKTLLSQVKYAQYVTIALFSKTPIFDQAFDLAILDGEVVTDLYDSTWVERHYNPELKTVKEFIASAYLAPKSAADTSLLALTDEQLMATTYDELSKVIPNIKQKVTGYDIKRFKYAYPVMTPGAYSRLATLRKSFNGVYLAGDYMKYPTIEAAFSSGDEAAKQAMQQ